jgi:hypothetical protein
MITGLEKTLKPTAVHCEGDTHEIPVRPLTLDGIAWDDQVRPTFVPRRTALVATAKQTLVMGHEAECTCPIPKGVDSEDQAKPPVVVAMIGDPAPVLPLSPTLTQSFALAQEIPIRSTAFEGGDWLDHDDPLSRVPIT